MELDYKPHKNRYVYEYMLVNKLKERFLRNGDGSLITTSEELIKKCGEYFNGLFNCEEFEEIVKFNRKTRHDQDCIELTLEEIRKQINNFNNP